MDTTEKINIDELLKRADALIKEGKDFMMSEGKVLELTKWLTIAEYAQKYNVTTQVVSKWIERGVIKEDDYVEIGKFGKKLVRDAVYME
jgi:DNA-binding transcriptional regulator YiaG